MKTCLAALAAVAGLASPALAAPPPASAFGGPAETRMVAISPNGHRLAMSAREGDQTVIRFETIDSTEAKLVKLGDVDISQIRWIGDDRVIVDVQFVTKIYQWYRSVGRVITVGADDGRVITMLADNKPANSFLRHHVDGISPDRHIYMLGYSTERASGPLVPLLLKIDPTNGKEERVEEGEAGVTSWLIGEDGTVHGRTVVRSQDFTVQTRAKPGEQWKTFWSAKFDDLGDYHGYSHVDDALVLTQHGAEGDQLVLKKLADGAVVALGQPHKTDPMTQAWDPKGRRLAGQGFGGERSQVEWFQQDLGAVHSGLAKLFKNGDVALLDWSADRTRFVFSVFGPDTPTLFYLFDKTRREVSPLGEMHPNLKGVPLGTTHWITYKARDGLEISAYVTMPPGGKDGQHLPLVVLPHPTLTGRDIYDFDYLAQFLASRGYVVLRPQFRGSGGFGKAFEKAGDWQWGAKVETDLLDGVAQLASAGTIDPKRVCIVGSLFGGYLALAAATLYPQDYACAVAISGASDLTGVVSGWGGAPFASMRKVLKGTDPRDPRYAAMSPRVHAASARGPILLMWNDQDATMPPEQSQAMVNALAASHRSYETVILSDPHNDHLVGKLATQSLEAIDAFLAKNLPVQ